MKMTYQRRLTLSFLVIFGLFSLGVTVFEQSRARRYRTEGLEEKLDAYSDVVETWLAQEGNSPSGLDTLIRLLPANLRITVIGNEGIVAFDNLFPEPSVLENHLNRPEIVAAGDMGAGYDIRTSASNRHEYIYYAKPFDGGYIRVALPYDVNVRSLLKPDNAFFYFVVLLFIAGLVFIHYFGSYFGRIERLLMHEKTRRLKHEMTGNIAHELRTPVTSIRGFLETMLDTPLTPEQQRKFTEKAYNQTLNLSELIRDMGLLTKIEEMPSGSNFKPVELRAAVERVESELHDELARGGISFRNEVPVGAVVKGNESLLYSVFRNLTDNAIKYAGQDAVVTVRMTNRNDGRMRISYADSGKGIADESQLERIFERFYRIDAGRTRDSGGSGLGLSIVKNALLIHGGTISARNRPEGGLEFLIELPVN
jgi:signal transduction histidine kinase